MKTLLALVILFFISHNSLSQKIVSHNWEKSNVYFETAKYKIKNNATGKFGVEQFKTSYIKIENTDLSWPDITIDIPDKYFGKEFTMHKTSYEITPGDLELVSYVLITKDDKDMVGLSIYYHAGDDSPYQILVSVYENYVSKTSKNHSYLLMEFK